jgi:AcrR family transcriptional regulator
MPTTRDATGPATAKGEATRAFLLHTAAAVFAERGYTATTMGELISASGLTKGAFYFHFRSKADLALAVVADQQGRWLGHVREQLAAEPGAAGLRAVVPVMLEMIEREPGAWSITRLTQELATEPDVGPAACRFLTEWVDMIADLVRRGQADGEVTADLDPDAVAAVLVAAFDGLKALTGALAVAGAAGGDPQAQFRHRAQTLFALVERALLGHPG